jgi:hypothetical protein
LQVFSIFFCRSVFSLGGVPTGIEVRCIFIRLGWIIVGRSDIGVRVRYDMIVIVGIYVGVIGRFRFWVSVTSVE